jgi:hypothetical protein
MADTVIDVSFTTDTFVTRWTFTCKSAGFQYFARCPICAGIAIASIDNSIAILSVISGSTDAFVVPVGKRAMLLSMLAMAILAQMGQRAKYWKPADLHVNVQRVTKVSVVKLTSMTVSAIHAKTMQLVWIL